MLMTVCLVVQLSVSWTSAHSWHSRYRMTLCRARDVCTDHERRFPFRHGHPHQRQVSALRTALLGIAPRCRGLLLRETVSV
jgi:hypothetical protein